MNYHQAGKRNSRDEKTQSWDKKDPVLHGSSAWICISLQKGCYALSANWGIRSCAMRPTKRDPHSTMKDNSSETESLREYSQEDKLESDDLIQVEKQDNSHHSIRIGICGENSLYENTAVESADVRSSSGLKETFSYNPEMVADLDLGEHAFRAEINNSASAGLSLNVSGGVLAQQTDLATGDSDQLSLSRKASSRDDPLKVVKQMGYRMKAERFTWSTRRLMKGLQESWQKKNKTRTDLFQKVTIEHQWQDSQLVPSQRSVDLNVENQQWQDSQLAANGKTLAEPSQRRVDLNVENQPVREKQTGELLTENLDEQNKKIAQLASYPFGDYWSDPCLGVAYKTLTGAIPLYPLVVTFSDAVSGVGGVYNWLKIDRS
ncbi:hypothetical protein HAX54_041338 [Datura stramonium]|uniref:Uncharacterized protein n=1 Tax=Datura stramonium TaxID=4076 RepID=A0ABS8SL91_DATST|nr:hypothetical protein [Datura stramonium]